MKRRTRKFLVAGSTLTGLLAAMLIWDARQVGQALDNYRGVPVYDNGLLFFRSHGRHYAADGYYYGQKWQCVEFIKRFYHQARGHKLPNVMGHAKSFFDQNLPDGATNAARGLVQYRNGSIEPPQLDDLVVFADTKFGHVGIVSEADDRSIQIIQQNIFGHTRQRLSLLSSNGHYFVTAPRIPAGWLRKPRSAGR
jgi:surface antigen